LDFAELYTGLFVWGLVLEDTGEIKLSTFFEDFLAGVVEDEYYLGVLAGKGMLEGH
jgi:hypothetical protein